MCSRVDSQGVFSVCQPRKFGCDGPCGVEVLVVGDSQCAVGVQQSLCCQIQQPVYWRCATAGVLSVCDDPCAVSVRQPVCCQCVTAGVRLVSDDLCAVRCDGPCAVGVCGSPCTVDVQ